MPRKVKMNWQGQEVEAEKIPVNNMREEWNQYFLEDGTVLRARLIVSDVLRLVGIYTAEGDPVYVIKSANFVNSDVPESLRHKPKGD
jgi:hypothetical protein